MSMVRQQLALATANTNWQLINNVYFK